MPTTPHHKNGDSEHIYYASTDSHTAIPDWVPFAHQLTAEARNLITATLVLQKRGRPPTRRQLAEALSVDERTVYRWLAEIAGAGAMSTGRAGRRRMCIFHKPKPDHMITDHMITDRPISDRPIRFRDSDDRTHERQQSHDPAIPDHVITDRAGGGGDHDSISLDSPPTTKRRGRILPAEITGDTGRWMVAEGFSLSKAKQHQDLPLAPAQADYQRRRQLGQGHGAIAQAWEVAPPAGDMAPAPVGAYAGEFTFSEQERARYKAMGMLIGDELPESEDEA